MSLNNGLEPISKEEFRKKYILMLRIITLFLLLYAPILYFGKNNFTDENDAVWFQRSGSLLVFLSVFLQFLYGNFVRMINTTIIDFGDGNPRTEMQDFHLRRQGKKQWRSDPTFSILFELWIFSIAAYGTVIWGYGDLLYDYLK